MMFDESTAIQLNKEADPATPLFVIRTPSFDTRTRPLASRTPPPPN